MTGADWPDPFAEDEAARERERRRAEREARRLKQRRPRPREPGGAGRPASRTSLTRATAPACRRRRPPGHRRRRRRRHPARRRTATGAGGCLAVGALVAAIVVVVADRGGGPPPRPATARPRSRPRPGPRRRSRSPRATTGAQIAAIAEAGRTPRRLPEGERELQGLRPRQVRGAEPAEPRGLPVPGDLRAAPPPDRRRPGGPPAGGLQAEHLAGRHALRAVEEPDHLRRADHRLDDRARGPGAEGAQAGRGRDLQPPPRRDAAPDRRDDPLRDRQLHQALSPSELQLDSPYNTYTNSGLPPDPIGNPGLASIEAAAHPANVPLPLLRGQARHLRRAHVRHHRRPSSTRRRPPTTRRAPRTGATRRRLRAARADAHGSPSSASRSRTRARRRCRPPRWPSSGSPGSGPTRRSRSPPPTSRRACARWRPRASWAPTSPFRTSSRRSSSPAMPPRPPWRSAPPTRSASPQDGSQPRTPTPAGFLDALAGAAGRQARPGARRRRLGARRGLGAGHARRRGRDLEPHARAGRAPGRGARRSASRPRPATCRLSPIRPDRQRHHGGHGRRRVRSAADLKSLPLVPIRWARHTNWWTSPTGRPRRSSPGRRERAAQRSSTGSRCWFARGLRRFASGPGWNPRSRR